MNTRNNPIHPGAMTPAEQTRRTLSRLAYLAAVATMTAAGVAILAALLIVF